MKALIIFSRFCDIKKRGVPGWRRIGTDLRQVE
jgi:hypothetical protein